MDVAECMKTSPDAPRPPRHRTEAREGLLYVVSLVPEARPLRIKIGFTSAGIEKRMDAFRTPCPTAVLVCAWPALSSDERRVLAALPGRIGQSEVFACDDVDVLVRKIMRTLAAA